MLREFEISCTDPAFYGEWKWLPSAPVNAHFDIGNLQALTLHHVPFKWSSPMLRNLRNLQLRSLPTVHITLDRILHIVAANPLLESLTMHFASPHPPVLPLTPVTLSELKTLNLGGHYLLSSLVESLMLPALDTLILDIEARDPIEEAVSALLTRSGTPPLTRLSLCYGASAGAHAGFYWGSSAGVTSWHFLGELEHLAALPFALCLLLALLLLTGSRSRSLALSLAGFARCLVLFLDLAGLALLLSACLGFLGQALLLGPLCLLLGQANTLCLCGTRAFLLFAFATLLLAGLVAAAITSPLFDRVLTSHLAITCKILCPLLGGLWLSLIWAGACLFFFLALLLRPLS